MTMNAFVFLVLVVVLSLASPITAAKCLVAQMTSKDKTLYPNISGTISVCFDSKNIGTLKMDVVGLRPNIKAGTAGVHIHKGTSCATEDIQQGHYFKSGTGGPMKDGDPWYTHKSTIAPAGTSYTTCPMGKAKYQDFTFYNGKNYASTFGKVVVIHDTTASGAKRIACGVLKVQTQPFV